MSPISAMRESFRIFDMAASRASRDEQTIREKPPAQSPSASTARPRSPGIRQPQAKGWLPTQ